MKGVMGASRRDNSPAMGNSEQAALSQLKRNDSGEGGGGDRMVSMQEFQAERESVCKGREVSGEQGPLQEPK